LSLVVYLLCQLVCLPFISAAPTKTKTTSASPSPTILGPQPPHFVAYSDESQFGIPKASDLQGFNTLILAFLLASGPADQAQAWTQLSASQRATLKADYKNNNITLMVSAFGSTESPTTDGKDPTALAESMASWVKQWDMDGIDVDYEDFEAVGKGRAVSWLETFTSVLRNNLPDGEFVITHAPVAPWFGKGQPYAQLDASVGKHIDWYNVQFYSQGTAYTTCDTLVSQSGDPFPGTSLLEIVASGVPQQKVVMGKPGTAVDAGAPDFGDGGGGAGGGGGTQLASSDGTEEAGGGTQDAGGSLLANTGGTSVANGDTEEACDDSLSADTGGTSVASGDTEEACDDTEVANGGTQEASPAHKRANTFNPHVNGFVETNTLASCMARAQQNGWNAGVMVWEYPDANSEWIQTVRQFAWPFQGKN